MPDETPPSLEGEILHQRYAIVAVHSAHGDWVRCRIYDMQALSQHEAVVQLAADGEHEIELLPDEAPADTPADTGAHVETKTEAVDTNVEGKAEPASEPPPPPAPGPPPTPEPPPPASEPDSSEDGEKGKSAKPGKLEAAWFALGADSEQIDDEDRPHVEDGDLLIAPSKVEERAGELTTRTYMRYRIDETAHKVRAPAVQGGGAATLPSRKPMWIMLVVGLGVVTAVLVLLLR